MPSSRELAAFLPDVRLARDAGLHVRGRSWLSLRRDLLSSTPRRAERVACVLLRARVVVRSVREHDFETPERDLSRIPERIPEPSAELATSVRVVAREIAGVARMCVACGGNTVCARCKGKGHLVNERYEDGTMHYDRESCTRCSGTGTYTCAVCSGVGRMVPVRGLIVADELHTIHYTYLPTLPFALGEAVLALFEAELGAEGRPPDALRISLERPRADSPYRSAARSAEGSIEGFSLGEALPVARDAVDRLRARGELLREDVHAYAWPILRLNYGLVGHGTDVVLLVDPSGRPRALVG